MESEALDDSMDLAASVSFASRPVRVGQGDKVTHGLRAVSAEQAKGDVSDGFFAEGDFQGHFRGDGSVGSLDWYFFTVLNKQQSL